MSDWPTTERLNDPQVLRLTVEEELPTDDTIDDSDDTADEAVVAYRAKGRDSADTSAFERFGERSHEIVNRYDLLVRGDEFERGGVDRSSVDVSRRAET